MSIAYNHITVSFEIQFLSTGLTNKLKIKIGESHTLRMGIVAIAIDVIMLARGLVGMLSDHDR
jgi:hypothetical protein